MDIFSYYEKCRLCPRQCNADRLNGNGRSYCKSSNQLKIGHIGPHFGEEPPISGKNGSGTVFLSGCSLKCSFCQNYQISHSGLGTPMRLRDLGRGLKDLIQRHRVHNINFVTPDHFFPHIFEVISRLRKDGVDLPMVFNTSGYQTVEMLRHAAEFADIYLPDFKYSDESLASSLSQCRDYPQVALSALSEMVRQKGFLDNDRTKRKIAEKGVLVRHLILPGHVENSINALTTLFLEFGSGLPLSLMSQYHPLGHHNDTALNRSLTETEFRKVYSHALDLGFENLFVQFPQKKSGNRSVSPFLPDFTKAEPFSQYRQ